MAYLVPSEFVTKMVDAGESKIYMSTRDALIRAYMAGAILALSAVFAVSCSVATGVPLIGALLFPVGFCMLYLLGFDLLTGVFVLTPLALIDRRPGVTLPRVVKHWGIVFAGNFLGAFTVAFLMAYIFTFGFHTDGGALAKAIGTIGEKRTLGYAEYGFAGMVTLFIRGMLCNWMVSTGVVGAMISTTVGGTCATGALTAMPSRSATSTSAVPIVSTWCAVWTSTPFIDVSSGITVLERNLSGARRKMRSSRWMSITQYGRPSRR